MPSSPHTWALQPLQLCTASGCAPCRLTNRHLSFKTATQAGRPAGHHQGYNRMTLLLPQLFTSCTPALGQHQHSSRHQTQQSPMLHAMQIGAWPQTPILNCNLRPSGKTLAKFGPRRSCMCDPLVCQCLYVAHCSCAVNLQEMPSRAPLPPYASHCRAQLLTPAARKDPCTSTPDPVAMSSNLWLAVSILHKVRLSSPNIMMCVPEVHPLAVQELLCCSTCWAA